MPIEVDLNEWVEEYRREHNGITRVAGADATSLIRQHSTPTELVLGKVAHTGDPVVWNLHTGSPHLLVSMGSGAGKSALLRLLMSQHLMHGGKCVVLDYKRHSHRWVRHLGSRSGVTYCRDIAEIHETLCALAAHARKRNRLADRLSDVEYDSGRGVGVPVMIAFEEMNATISEIETYWKGIGGRGVSPAISGLRELLATGRAVGMHVVAVAQRASARAMGGGDARENFATRVLSRHTRRTWDMLAEGIPYVSSSEVPGRAVMVQHGTAVEVQLAYLTESPQGGETVAVAQSRVEGDSVMLGSASTGAELLVVLLDGYDGDNVWQDVILPFKEYDPAATAAADPSGASDVVVMSDGSVARWDRATGTWYAESAE